MYDDEILLPTSIIAYFVVSVLPPRIQRAPSRFFDSNWLWAIFLAATQGAARSTTETVLPTHHCALLCFFVWFPRSSLIFERFLIAQVWDPGNPSHITIYWLCWVGLALGWVVDWCWNLFCLKVGRGLSLFLFSFVGAIIYMSNKDLGISKI